MAASNPMRKGPRALYISPRMPYGGAGGPGFAKATGIVAESKFEQAEEGAYLSDFGFRDFLTGRVNHFQQILRTISDLICALRRLF